MPGTKAGGKLASITNKTKYGSDFYSKIGTQGGKIGRTGGFHYMKKNNPELLKELSGKGGRNSRRPKKNA